MSRLLVSLALVLIVAGHGPARAGEAGKFAVLSIIGDRMLIVSHRGETGTRVDQDRRDYLDMPPRVLDNSVVKAMDAAIKQAAPGTEVVMLGGSPALYAAQAGTEDPDEAPVIRMVREPLEKAGVTHLVLVSRLRHEAMLRFSDGYVGSGRLEGIGFYLDHALPTRNVETGQTGVGFLAPFAYFRVSLVDMGRGEAVARRDVLASQSVTAGRSPSLQVWEALSAGEKVRIIDGMTRREAVKAVSELLAENAAAH